MADLASSDRLNDYEHNLYLLSQVGSVEHKRFAAGIGDTCLHASPCD
jgi:hypothetical protein